VDRPEVLHLEGPRPGDRPVVLVALRRAGLLEVRRAALLEVHRAALLEVRREALLDAALPEAPGGHPEDPLHEARRPPRPGVDPLQEHPLVGLLEAPPDPHCLAALPREGRPVVCRGDRRPEALRHAAGLPWLSRVPLVRLRRLAGRHRT
jgi:hypothetical protein